MSKEENYDAMECLAKCACFVVLAYLVTLTVKGLWFIIKNLTYYLYQFIKNLIYGLYQFIKSFITLLVVIRLPLLIPLGLLYLLFFRKSDKSNNNVDFIRPGRHKNQNEDNNLHHNNQSVSHSNRYNNHDNRKIGYDSRVKAKKVINRMKEQGCDGSNRLNEYYNSDYDQWYVGRGSEHFI